MNARWPENETPASKSPEEVDKEERTVEFDYICQKLRGFKVQSSVVTTSCSLAPK